MAKVNVDKLVKDFLSAVGYPYVSPGNTTMSTIENGVDCSGLFVAAFKDQGASIYHGSNTIWRQYLTDKGSIKGTGNTSYKQQNSLTASQLKVGMAVFKWNPNTPSKFKDGLGDYQHIGLVTSVNPLRITHASTDGMQVRTDTKIGKFCAWGLLKNVDYQENVEEDKKEVDVVSYQAIVSCTGSLNVRQGAGTGYAKVGRLLPNTAVNIIAESNGWANIVSLDANRTSGWVDMRYIKKTEESIQDVVVEQGQKSSTIEQLAEQIKLLKARVSALQNMMS